MQALTVLSLFDGIACGFEALKSLNIPIKKYYASEIDRYAISVASYNHPKIIQLGDISNWKNWDIDFSSIDLILAGFPCQSWSMAGNQKADKDPRGALVFHLLDILNKIRSFNSEVKFLFENVRMKKQFLDYLNDLFQVKPILINSSLVSAQNRQRYYWTNIEGVEQPEDRKIYLKDILLDGSVDRCKSFPITTSVGRTTNREYWRKKQGGLVITDSFCGRLVGRRINQEGKRDDYNKNIPIQQRYESRLDAKSGALTTVQKDNLLLELQEFIHSPEAIKYMNRYTKDGKRNHWDFGHHSDVNNEKSAAVVANFFKGVPNNVLKSWNCIRKFHPIECERLQTLFDNYTLYGIFEGDTKKISNTQRYKMIGNSWTVETIKWILNFM